MKPAPFAYVRPATVAEASALLAADPDARLIAGGQTLIPMMAMRLARPSKLIDISRIDEVRFIVDRDDDILIGAATRQVEVERSQLIKAKLPLLAAAMPWVGHAPTRARGTVGGSIANADPAAEIPLVLATLAGHVDAMHGAARTSYDARHLFVGPMTTALPASACLVEVSFPVWREPRIGAGFHEVSARKSDFAYVSAAAQVALDDSGKVLRLAVGIGGATPVPTRLDAVSAALEGAMPDGKRIRDAVAAAMSTQEIMRDSHASEAYRRRVAIGLAERAIMDAVASARASGRPRVKVDLTINGTLQSVDVEPRTTLLDCVRDNLALTGTHTGCEHGVCGACTVLIDGEPARSCLMFAVQADGYAITTIEALAPAPGELSVVQDAFVERHGMQCGYCTPAMILTAHALLARNASPTREDIVDAISGNICRCTGYGQIVEAIELAAERLRGSNEGGAR